MPEHEKLGTVTTSLSLTLPRTAALKIAAIALTTTTAVMMTTAVVTTTTTAAAAAAVTTTATVAKAKSSNRISKKMNFLSKFLRSVSILKLFNFEVKFKSTFKKLDRQCRYSTQIQIILYESFSDCHLKVISRNRQNNRTERVGALV